MSDNRFPALLEAAMEALQAVTDVGVERGPFNMTPDAVGYLIDRKAETGQSLDQRLEQVHGKLQKALKPYMKEIDAL